MNFAELRFWELLTGALAFVLVLRATLFRSDTWAAIFDRCGLLFIGLVLLLAVSRVTFLIFLVVAVGTYLGLALILRLHGRAPRRYLLVLIPLQLLPLFYYKYAGFLARDVLGWQFDTLQHLIIPVGISFYTFQKVAFVVDTLGFQQPLPRFLDYMNFAGFFPQIVAGPIERRKDLLPQMEAFRFAWNPESINIGAGWIALGFFFKAALADNLALYFRPAATGNAYLIWINNLLFGLRIYYDFAGYSFIALGLAHLFGVRLTLNFASPYCAVSITEFWRRWHITLSQWFRDYVYFPLGGGRQPWWVANVMIVFLISGVWHGAGWNFVLWGALHGFYLVLNRLLGPRLRLPVFLGWAITLAATFLAWLCFYETDVTALLLKLRALFTPGAYSLAHLHAVPGQWIGRDLFVLGCFLALSLATFLGEWRSLRRGGEPLALLRRPAVLFVLVVLTVLLAPGKSNGFIYFAF